MLESGLVPSVSAMFLSFSCYTAIAIVMVGIIAFACFENYTAGKSDNVMDGLVLDEKQRNRDGYTSSTNKNELIGAIGVCATDLRPSGTITVEGEPVDVVTEGGFVDKGNIVKVIGVEGARVVVRRI